MPFKAGLRYNLSSGGVYLEPQLGYTSISSKNSNNSNTGGFTYAAALGTMLQAIDLSVRYEGVSRNGTTLPFIGIRGAYNFRL
jgi:outer membrane autotransporter protein